MWFISIPHGVVQSTSVKQKYLWKSAVEILHTLSFVYPKMQEKTVHDI